MNVPTRHIFGRLLNGETLPEADAQALFSNLLAGCITEQDIAAILAAIAARGPTVDELVGAARAMRAHATTISIPPTSLPILDTCGTGGAPKLFNVSTISAIVVAAAAPRRVIVAKHGNRSRTGRGSAELLEALGVNIHQSPEAQAACIREIGLCFAFAPDHHPAARHASAVRKKLAFPTIFNLLGPLVNPAGATRQLVGTYSIQNAEKLAHALARLGTERAMVVSSLDGLDELTTTAPTVAFTVSSNQVNRTEIDAPTLGLPRAAIAQLQVHTLDQAADLARALFGGRSGPARDIVLLNAAASLHVCGLCTSLAQGIALAREAITSDRALNTYTQFVALSHS